MMVSFKVVAPPPCLIINEIRLTTFFGVQFDLTWSMCMIHKR